MTDFASTINAIVSTIWPILAAVLGAIATAYTARIVAAIEARTGVQVTTQQVNAVRGAVYTAGTMVQKAVDKGLVTHADLNITNPYVKTAVQHVLDSVPDALHHLETQDSTVVDMVLSRVDLPVPTVPIAPATVAMVPVPVVAIGDAKTT